MLSRTLAMYKNHKSVKIELLLNNTVVERLV